MKLDTASALYRCPDCRHTVKKPYESLEEAEARIRAKGARPAVPITHRGDVMPRARTVFDFRFASNQTRLLRWGFAVLMFLQNPVFGAGYTTFALVYENEAFLGENIRYQMGAHSEYFQVLAETGLVGFAGWMAVLIAPIAGSFSPISDKLAQDLVDAAARTSRTPSPSRPRARARYRRTRGSSPRDERNWATNSRANSGSFAAPGDDAIEAALHPEDGPWFFYVTVNLATGETKFTDSYDEFKELIEKPGFVWAHWDGTRETENKIQEETKATIRCVPLAGAEDAGPCVVCGTPPPVAGGTRLHTGAVGS